MGARSGIVKHNKLDALSAESVRLAALHALSALDTEAAPELEPLCANAARLCATPIAWIALIDEHRHWLKASWGWNGPRSQPRSAMPCNAVIAPDRNGASRVAPARIPGDAGVSFYAGVPLTLPCGSQVGTLAVLDQVERDLSAEQLAGLAQIATLVVEILVDSAAFSLDLAPIRADARGAASLYVETASGRVFHASETARRVYAEQGLPLVGEQAAMLVPGYAACSFDELDPTSDCVLATAAAGSLATDHLEWQQLTARVAARCDQPIVVLRGELALNPAGATELPDDSSKAAQFLRFGNQVLLQGGYGNFSVRKVAKAANVGVGHLQHYFPTKEALLSAMIDSLSQTLWHHYARQIAPVKNPLDRLLACAVFVLDEGALYDRARLLREYTVMSQHEPRVAQALTAYFARSRQTVVELLREIHPQLSQPLANARASEIVSLLSSAFLFTRSMESTGVVQGYDDYLKARMVELAHFPEFLPLE